MERVDSPENKQLFVADSNGQINEVRELMNSRHVEEQKLAIDALKGWCRMEEQLTEAPEGKSFHDRHHWYNKKAGKGAPYSQWRQLPEHITLLRRDIHERVEHTFQWLTKPLKEEVMMYLQPEAEAA